MISDVVIRLMLIRSFPNAENIFAAMPGLVIMPTPTQDILAIELSVVTFFAAILVASSWVIFLAWVRSSSMTENEMLLVSPCSTL